MTTKDLQLVADGFSFPTSVAFDDNGTAYVAESGLPFDGAQPGGRVWRLGRARELVAEGFRQPVNGLVFHRGALYVSEGGHPGRISRLDLDGTYTTLLDNLPGPGNYHTNMAVFGPDSKLYFSLGAMTNAGIIGLDAYEMGWLRRLPHAHDIPGYDVTLTGASAETGDPLAGDTNSRAVTGAFAPFGTATSAGDRLRGRVPCTAAVMRCDPSSGELELVAWGLRNAYGLAFTADGRLLATDQGADERGSRPIGNAPDSLFEVKSAAWYGWPDFIGGIPVTDARFRPERGPAPTFLLANHDELPPPEPPLFSFPPHAAAAKLAPLPPEHPVWPDQILVALFGDERPLTAPAGPRVGRSLARIDLIKRTLHVVSLAPLDRPIDVVLHPDGDIYILDFGHFEMGTQGAVEAVRASGKLWRMTFAGSGRRQNTARESIGDRALVC